MQNQTFLKTVLMCVCSNLNTTFNIFFSLITEEHVSGWAQCSFYRAAPLTVVTWSRHWTWCSTQSYYASPSSIPKFGATKQAAASTILTTEYVTAGIELWPLIPYCGHSNNWATGVGISQTLCKQTKSQWLWKSTHKAIYNFSFYLSSANVLGMWNDNWIKT